MAITGVASSPDFAKWQLDLLLAGAADQAGTIAVGETPVESPSLLASLDTTSLPDGPYTLRLRVVRKDGNYSEYPVTITIANHTASHKSFRGLSQEAFGAQGYRVLMWDIDTQDWQRPGSDVVASSVLKRAFPGAVVLMHDSGGRTSQVPAALEIILAELGARGYVFQSLNN